MEDAESRGGGGGGEEGLTDVRVFDLEWPDFEASRRTMLGKIAYARFTSYV